MNRRRLWLIGPACLALAGCGQSTPNDHGGHEREEHAHAEDVSPVTFKEGVGLQLSPETTQALGLQTGEVEDRTVQHTYEVTATVFDAGPPARASSFIPGAIADELELHPPVEARLLAIHRELTPAVTQVEAVFALPGSPAVGSTVNLTLRGPSKTGTAIPKTALLRTATETYVYVANGASFLRTAVKTGASDLVYTEILDGLYAGDVVVTAGVEQLWLTELRLTKGGGHSH